MNLAWSGNKKILQWNKGSFGELLEQMTIDEIETMNDYLDSECYDVKGLSESHAEYVKAVLFTYIRDWLKLVIEADCIEEAKELFAIYCAAAATCCEI